MRQPQLGDPEGWASPGGQGESVVGLWSSVVGKGAWWVVGLWSVGRASVGAISEEPGRVWRRIIGSFQKLMSKAHKFFRYVWRVNAVLICLAAALTVIGLGALLIPDAWRSLRARDPETGVVVPPTASGEHLQLGRASILAGTDVMRADLTSESAREGFSSGGSSEIRNILFIDPSQKSAHWLLADNNQVISDVSDITDEETARRPKRLFATVLLVKQRTASREDSVGRLLLLDPRGKNVVEVSGNVSDIELAALSGDAVTVLYERNRRFVLTRFNPESLAKLTEQEIDVPELKQ
jgi:hypothetical protein